MSTQQTLPEQLAPLGRPKGQQKEDGNEKKRKADPPREAPPLASRKRAATDTAPLKQQPDEEIIAEYRCPITQELPLDPVVAEDGQCYDRSAIEEWFQKHWRTAKSPMTNQPMGKKLVPALQMRNSIERLVAKGILTGEAADTWKERTEELRNLDEDWRNELQLAHKGEASSMCAVGLCYREGHNGFKKDQSKAIEWLRKAADLDDSQAVCNMAIFYINGQGLEQDLSRGFFELGRAAVLGSEHAAACAGNYYKTGSRFCSGKDEAAAARWYKVSRNAKTNDSVDDFRKQRDDWLKARGHCIEDGGAPAQQ
jgi:hypothetical protein